LFSTVNSPNQRGKSACADKSSFSGLLCKCTADWILLFLSDPDLKFAPTNLDQDPTLINYVGSKNSCKTIQIYWHLT
jgi:hypothetical protein